MADLPDLNTTGIGHLVYWNAIDDGGVPNIDPEEITSSGWITSYTLYDNGIEGELDHSKYTPHVRSSNGEPRAGFRVKSDGWIVVWVEDRANYGQEETGGSYSSPGTYPDTLAGWWDFAPYIFAYDEKAFAPPPADINRAGVFQAVDHLRNQLSNGGAMTFNYSDIGMYFYGDESATTTTLLMTQTGSAETPGFTHTSNTDIKRCVATATSSSSSSGNDTTYRVQFEGETLAFPDGGDYQLVCGSMDLINKGIVPSAGEELNHEPGGSPFREIMMSALSVWS